MELTNEYQLLDEKYLGSSGGSLYIRLYAKYSEQDLINNKTKVQYQARANYINGNYIYDAQGNGSVSGTGANEVGGTCPRPTTGETVIATTEGWVTHNKDGKKTISASATLNFPNWGWTQTAEGSAELPKIPRNSDLIYVSGKENEDYPTIIVDTSTKINIKYTKNVESYFDKLSIIAEIEGQTQLIKTIAESDGLIEDYVFSLTQNEIDAILEFTKNTNLGTTSDGLLNIGYLKFQLSTYSDSTMENQIGNISTISRVARIKISEAAPTLTATLKDVNDKTISLTNNENILVRYASTARITPTYSANKFAYIKSVTINEIELGNYGYLDIVNSSTTTYIIVVTDSRNLSTTLVFQSINQNGDNFFKLIDYIPLTIRIDNLERNQPADNKMKLIYSGNYYDGNFSENILNTLEVNFRYKKSIGDEDYSEWISLSPLIENTIYSQTFISDAVLDYESVYDIQVQAIDKLNNLLITDLKLNKGIPIANWDDDKFNINGKLTINNQEVSFGDENGTSDYEKLINKPSINNVILLGNKTFEDLNAISLSNSEIENIINSNVL